MNLSTLSKDLDPLASYGTFVRPNRFEIYTLISQVAKHYENLEQSKKASVMFIEDECECENIFARKRAIFECSAHKISRDEDEFLIAKELYLKKYGEFANTILNMLDFSFFKLKFIRGSLVFGFGKAYEIKAPDFLEFLPINAQGHKNEQKGGF